VEEDTYTTGQAARILRMSDRGVRKMIDRGELEASTDERGRHLIPQRALHAMLEERRSSTAPPEISDEEASRSVEEARELRQRGSRPCSASSGAWRAVWSSQRGRRAPCERSASAWSGSLRRRGPSAGGYRRGWKRS